MILFSATQDVEHTINTQIYNLQCKLLQTFYKKQYYNHLYTQKKFIYTVKAVLCARVRACVGIFLTFFQSNFSATRILSSSYLFWAKEVGGLLVIILQF
jgi:hypothetical protein